MVTARGHCVILELAFYQRLISYVRTRSLARRHGRVGGPRVEDTQAGSRSALPRKVLHMVTARGHCVILELALYQRLISYVRTRSLARRRGRVGGPRVRGARALGAGVPVGALAGRRPRSRSALGEGRGRFRPPDLEHVRARVGGERKAEVRGPARGGLGFRAEGAVRRPHVGRRVQRR